MNEIWIVNNEKVTSRYERDVQIFQELRNKKNVNGTLSASQNKRMIRIQTKLMKAGIIRRISREKLRQITQERYKRLPLLKRILFKTKYFFLIILEKIRIWKIDSKIKKLIKG